MNQDNYLASGDLDWVLGLGIKTLDFLGITSFQGLGEI
jgi:hypothetical protein